LGGTPVSDLGPVANLGELRYLDLSDTEIESVESLKACANLLALNLAGTKVSDWRPLTGLESLRWLIVSGGEEPVFEELKARGVVIIYL
jgi:Leucine-rich repeat (LRR) protein